eukprot:scaffold3461_cov18-Prasinocladus_malaysianus.AAC.2
MLFLADAYIMCRSVEISRPHAYTSNFTDVSLDFSNVDARHDYKSAWEDKVSYWPKLRCGGILAGDDYDTQDELIGRGGSSGGYVFNCDGTKDKTRRATKGAINDFAAMHNRQLTITYREKMFDSFMMRK